LSIYVAFFFLEAILASNGSNIFHIFYKNYILSIYFSFLSLFCWQKEKIGKPYTYFPFWQATVTFPACISAILPAILPLPALAGGDAMQAVPFSGRTTASEGPAPPPLYETRHGRRRIR